MTDGDLARRQVLENESRANRMSEPVVKDFARLGGKRDSKTVGATHKEVAGDAVLALRRIRPNVRPIEMQQPATGQG